MTVKAPALPSTPSAPLALEPNQIANRVAECLLRGDLDGIVSLFHPACQIFFPPGAPPKRGHSGVREAFKDFMPQRPILYSTVTSEIVNGDTAVLHADWRILSPTGVLLAEGQSTEVAKRLDNGGWGYFIDCPHGLPVHATSDVTSSLDSKSQP